MANRIASITRKRATLRSRITTLDTALFQHRIDKVNAKLRLARLTEVFKKYEVLNDELALIDPTNDGLNQMEEIQDSYYAIATKVEAMLDAGGSSGATHRASQSIQGIPLANSTIIERQQLLKLPVADLPKFDGDYDKWLSFKNTFLAMIESRTDLDDLNKFLYLRGSLTGPAFNKLALYDAHAENYRKAWDLLVENYEKKRILIAKHYDALIDITPSSRATIEGLNKIVDEARQHMNILDSLNSRPSDGLVVRLLERKLPVDVRRKWEETLTFDVFPTLGRFCKFISESAFCLSSFEQEQQPCENNNSSFRKCFASRAVNAPKARRVESGARALIMSSLPACVHCKGNHLLYKCPTFTALSVNQRADFVRAKRLGKNCLRDHKDPCVSTRCKVWDKFHHTLLHFNSSARQVTSRPSTSRTDTVEDKPTK